MNMSNSEIERSLAKYKDERTQAEARINSLLPDYGIEPLKNGTDPEAFINDQIVRLQIQRLITSEKQGLTNEKLLSLKHETLTDLLANDRIALESPWVDLINGIVAPDKPVLFDDATFALIESKRQEATRLHELVQEDIAHFLDELSPAEREDLGI